MALAMHSQGEGQTIASGTTGTADTVDVIFRLHRQVIVDRVADGGHVNTAGGNVGGNQNTDATVLNFGQGT